MKIKEVTKEIKINTIFKDNDGYFIVTDYDGQNDWYIFSQCTKFGKITDNSTDNMYFAKLENLIDVKIVKN